MYMVLRFLDIAIASQKIESKIKCFWTPVEISPRVLSWFPPHFPERERGILGYLYFYVICNFFSNVMTLQFSK